MTTYILTTQKDKLDIVCQAASQVVSEIADHENMTNDAATAMRSLRMALRAAGIDFVGSSLAL